MKVRGGLLFRGYSDGLSRCPSAVRPQCLPSLIGPRRRAWRQPPRGRPGTDRRRHPGHRSRLVPEHDLDRLRVGPGADRQRRGGVPEVAGRDLREAPGRPARITRCQFPFSHENPLHRGIEHSGAICGYPKHLAFGRREHQLVPALTAHEHRQIVGEKRREGHRPATVGLGGRPHQYALHLGNRLDHIDAAPEHIEAGDLQRCRRVRRARNQPCHRPRGSRRRHRFRDPGDGRPRSRAPRAQRVASP